MNLFFHNKETEEQHTHFVTSWADVSSSTLDLEKQSVYLIKTLDDHLCAHSKCCSMCMD